MTRIRSVLLLSRFPPDFAGGGLQASRLMQQLADSAVDVRVLTAMPERVDAPRRERAFGGEVIRFPVAGGRLSREVQLSLRAAWWLLVHRRWDILHVSGFSYFGVLPVLDAKALRRPVVIKTTVLGRDGAFSPGRSRLSRAILGTYRRADAIVALSRALEENLRAGARAGCRVLQIPNGVDFDLFRPALAGEKEAARAEFGLPVEGVVLLTAGMLYPRKNVIALVRAAAAMRARPLCVVMAGPPGPDADYLGQLDAEISRLPEGVQVRLVGSLEPDLFADLQRAADVFVLTSRAEGLPNSLLEGMATGLACVATEIPGTVDVLAGGGGRLVPLDEEAELVRVLDELAGDPDERRRLGAEARKIVVEHYSFSAVAGRYRRLYAWLLGASGDPA